MGGDYQKFTVDMRLMNDAYRLWKAGVDKVVCVVETYKEKRSIYFTVTNLTSSANLLAESNKEYRLMLMGVDDGEVIHRDFGAFVVNQKGEGNVFKKFGGPALMCYTHCILVCAEKEGNKVETVCSGELPFFQKEEEVTLEQQDGYTLLWHRDMEKATQGNPVQVFSKGWDETEATWYRISWTQHIPKPIGDCSVQIEKYGHYLLGNGKKGTFVGVPGRFLKAEQPFGDDGLFALWQPIKGGEKFFKNLAELSGGLQDEIFGYWIGGIDKENGTVIRL